MAHRCWTLARAEMTSEATRRDGLLRHGLARLDQLQVQVPDHMLVAKFIHTDENGAMIAAVFVPDEPSGLARQHRVEAWLRQFDVSVAAGFAGTLKRGDPTPAIARDPA